MKMPHPFLQFFQSNDPKVVLITSHQNADPDALCSAFAIKSLIHILYPEVVTIVSLDGVSNVSQKIMQEYNLEVDSPKGLAIDGIVIVDANSAEQVGNVKENASWNDPIFVIDHHVFQEKTLKFAQFSIIDEEAIATTEIVFEIFQDLNVQPSLETACLLFLGLLFDSRHLLLANNKTISIVHQLIELGANYSEMIKLLSVSMVRPERIARLKAAQRSTLHEFNGWLIVVSHTSAYEASACRALIRLGADVAIVYGQTKDGIRFSARATNIVAHETDLNLAKDVMEQIGPVMHGVGGGHKTAAGCSGIDNLEAGLDLALEILKNKLSSKSKLPNNE